MRIIHLANHCLQGHGNAHVAVDLACVQAENGHAVAYASAGGTYTELLTRCGVEHVHLVQDRRDPYSVIATTARLVRLCERFQPDILHAHMKPGAVLGYVASKIIGVPLVNTVHNSFDMSSNVMRLGRCVVAVSNAEKALLLQKGYPSDRLEVVINGPNGTPRERLQESEPSIEIHKPAVITICGLHKRKGVDFLIRAFHQAVRTQSEWNLYIAGAGPDYEQLIALRDELGLTDRVHLLGFVANPKKLLPQCEIFALASMAEPFGLAMSEARAAGCAVIGTAVGGIPEQLGYGKAGTLVEPANVEQLAAALHALMSDPEKLAQAKINAVTDSEYLNIKRVVADYDRVYERVLAAVGRRVSRPAPAVAAGNESVAHNIQETGS